MRHVVYRLKSSLGQPRHVKCTEILAEDHFGTHLFDTKKPEMLFVPAHLSLTETPALPSSGFTEHYKCCKVKQNKTLLTFKQTIASAADEFEDRFHQVFSPRPLCLPVDKNDEGILEPSSGLTCYRLPQGPGQPNHQRVENAIRPADQFGNLHLDTKVEMDLCVPAEILAILLP